MAKTTATPNSREWWQELRETICELYENNTLKTVMAYLRNEHDFNVTKRQLVYRLNKWHCKKYNTGEEGVISLPPTDDGTESHDEPLPHNEAECARSHAVPDGTDGHQIQTPAIMKAANAQLAICDGEGAFNTYARLNMDTLQGMVTRFRSAETEEQCRPAIELLKQYIVFSVGSSDWPLYCLLYVHVCDSIEQRLEQSMLADVRTAVSTILDNGDQFLLKSQGSVDMVAYSLLDNIDLNHRELLPDPADVKRLHVLLERFESRDDATPLEILRHCIAWCHRELFNISGDAARADRPDINVEPVQDQMLWKDHVEVFGTLWRILTKEGMSTGTWPEWVDKSVDVFNLAHAEVLSCICWLIVQSAASIRNASEDNAVQPVVRLFVNARMAAHQLFHGSQGDTALWQDFLETFLRFNSATVASTEENKNFGAMTAKEFRVFVKDTLGIDDDDGSGSNLRFLSM